MKAIILLLSSLCLLFLSIHQAQARYYGQKLCKQPDYSCFRVKSGQSWERLFPDPEQRDIVKRVNRMNRRLWAGLIIAVPKNLPQLTVYDVSPFPRYIESAGRKIIFIDQEKLAWGAYDEEGELIWWGPVSSGKNYCPDVGRRCGTPEGAFNVIRKQGIDCISSQFPIETYGGAPMPYCMHFYGGYALHGSYDVPGYRDSHGCVRLFIEDARWLNHEFIDLPGGDRKATRVIIDGLDL